MSRHADQLDQAALHEILIEVSVKDHGGKGRIHVQPHMAKVPKHMSDVKLVFRLNQNGTSWMFPRWSDDEAGDFYGIRIHDDKHGEFHSASRVSDTEVHLMDKNNNKSTYNYRVTLVQETHDDPAIENRSDGG